MSLRCKNNTLILSLQQMHVNASGNAVDIDEIIDEFWVADLARYVDGGHTVRTKTGERPLNVPMDDLGREV